jgi:hypothetical protein
MKTWFKFYGQEFLSDPKMLSLTATDKGIWLTLLCLASASGEEGTIRYVNTEKIMLIAGVNPLLEQEDWEDQKGFLKRFEDLKMITIDNDNDNVIIHIKNWEKRQTSALSGYERIKQFRQRKKENTAKIEANDNEMITDDNANDNRRIEKNRIDKKERVYTSQKYLLDIPIEDFSDIDATEKQIRLEGEKAHNWLLAKGTTRKDYKAFLRNWILKAYKKKVVTEPTTEYEIDTNGLARIKRMKIEAGLTT